MRRPTPGEAAKRMMSAWTESNSDQTEIGSVKQDGKNAYAYRDRGCCVAFASPKA
jgi:hypothetical protein